MTAWRLGLRCTATGLCIKGELRNTVFLCLCRCVLPFSGLCRMRSCSRHATLALSCVLARPLFRDPPPPSLPFTLLVFLPSPPHPSFPPSLSSLPPSFTPSASTLLHFRPPSPSLPSPLLCHSKPVANVSIRCGAHAAHLHRFAARCGVGVALCTAAVDKTRACALWASQRVGYLTNLVYMGA